MGDLPIIVHSSNEQRSISTFCVFCILDRYSLTFSLPGYFGRSPGQKPASTVRLCPAWLILEDNVCVGQSWGWLILEIDLCFGQSAGWLILEVNVCAGQSAVWLILEVNLCVGQSAGWLILEVNLCVGQSAG